MLGLSTMICVFGIIISRVERMLGQIQDGGVRFANCSIINWVTVESHSICLPFFLMICGVSFFGQYKDQQNSVRTRTIM